VLREDSSGNWWYESLSNASAPTWLVDALAVDPPPSVCHVAWGEADRDAHREGVLACLDAIAAGEGYQAFLTQLAVTSGIETPTRADLTRVDRTRTKKGSNDDWTSPADPDAKITKMKDGRTHLAHKAEHAVDLDTLLESEVSPSKR